VTTADAEPSAAFRHDPLRRWHAKIGLFPVGVFLFEHVVLNAKALRGQEAFERTTRWDDGIPTWQAIEILFVLLPLAVHAGLGVYLLTGTRAKEPSPYAPSWRVLNHAAAWVAVAFIAYHVWAIRVPRWNHAVTVGSLHTMLVAHLSSASGSASGVSMPWVGIFYLVGTAATILHFVVGGWGYLVRYRNVTTSAGTRRAAVGLGALGVALFAIASTTVISLASGAPLFVPQAPAATCAPQPPTDPDMSK
jgi:succinate dehydrogenase / fumarate reductase cytochrome b subunit